MSRILPFWMSVINRKIWFKVSKLNIFLTNLLAKWNAAYWPNKVNPNWIVSSRDTLRNMETYKVNIEVSLFLVMGPYLRNNKLGLQSKFSLFLVINNWLLLRSSSLEVIFHLSKKLNIKLKIVLGLTWIHL